MSNAEDEMRPEYRREDLGEGIRGKCAEQQAFIKRGLASRDAAKQSGEYVSSEEVLRELDRMLASAIQKTCK